MKLRLTSWFVLGVLLLSVVGVSATYVVLERRLMGEIDADLIRQLEAYQRYAETAGSAEDLVPITEEYLSGPSAGSLLSSGLMLVLLAPGGEVVASPGETRIEELVPPTVMADSGSPALLTTEAAGESYRLAASPVVADGSPMGVVAVAAPLGPTEDTLSRILLVLGVAALTGTVAIGLGSWLLIDRALDPVRRISQTAEAITQRDLSGRISYQGPHDEVGELAGTMNAMLERLQSAFEAQERFILDVSHELRTPLTIAKGHLQVLDRQDRPAPDLVRREHRLVLDELDRMNRLVADLLVIARSVRTDFLRFEAVDLDQLLKILTNQGGALAAREWRVEYWPGGTLWADQDRLVQAFLNLMQNAVKHTHEGDVIALGGRRQQGKVLLWVRDEGEGMPPDVQARVFDRFYRGKAGEGEAGESEGGLGLGLAIVRAIVQAHGGTLAVESEMGHGSTFTMALPLGTAKGGSRGLDPDGSEG